MSRQDKSPNWLLVEGEEDKRVIPYLMEANGIPWKKQEEPVFIRECGGYQNIDSTLISTVLQKSGLQVLGVIVDADDNLNERWKSIRNACLESIPDIPENLPTTGLIHPINDIQFGVWIMPDNQARGMLETFLSYLIPDESEPLWQYAQNVIGEAQNQGATFINSHFDKAQIYTWLAWQDPPGRQLHNAVMEKILNPNHPQAKPFVNWFKQLYDL